MDDTLDALVARGAERHASRPAIVDRGRVRTYAELEREVAATCEHLRALRVGAGDRVLVAFENCAEAIVLVLAIGRLGAWPVVASSRFAPAEIDAIARHCEPRLALFLSSSAANAEEHALRRGAKRVALDPIGALHVERLPGEPAPEPSPARPGDGVAAMIYTSGTTGAPKAAMITHANALFVGRTQVVMRRYTEDDKVWCVVPLSHAGALASILTSVLAAGGAIQLEQRFAPAGLARALRDDGITVVPGVPALHAKFVEWARANLGALEAPRLRMVTSASSPLPLSVKHGAEAVFGMPMQNGYGLTETAAVVSQTRLDDPRPDVSVGRPLPGVRVRLGTSEGAEVAPGDVGEVQVRGPNVFPGYYRDPAATRAAFTGDGWLRTGDLGRHDDAGNLVIAGRAKEMIKRSGYTVYPGDVEDALDRHPATLMSAVAGRPHGADEEIVAFVQLREGARATPAELLAWLAGEVVAYRCPSVVAIVPQLPTLHSGKVDRGAIRRMAAELAQGSSA